MPRRRPTFSRLVLPFALLITPALQTLAWPQETPDSPAFTSRVEWVPIDVIVLNGRGQPVPGLKEKDFTVLEDGEKQDILYFARRDWSADGADRTSEEAGTKETGRSPLLDTESSKRFFVFMLGRGRHSTFRLTEALTQFVREDLASGDPVALVAFNRASQFTVDRDKLCAALRLHGELHEGIHERLNLALSGMAGLYGTGEIPAGIQKDIDRIFEPFGGAIDLRAEQGAEKEDVRTRLHQILYQSQRADFDRAVGIAASGMPGSFSADDFDFFERLEFDLQTELPFDAWLDEQLKAKQDLLNLFAVIEYLRFVPGDKHILYFSDDGFTDDGLFLPRLEAENSLASMASDARVRIHTFTTEGTDLGSYLSASADSYTARDAAGAVPLSGGNVLKNTGAVYQPEGVIRASRSKFYQESGLMELSLRTGGQSFSHSDYRPALQGILEMTRQSYLLAYRPRKSFDTSFRRIEVRVKNKKARVLSRTGYFATSRPKLYDRESFTTYARTVQALRYAEPIGDIPFECSVSEPVFIKDSTRFSAKIRVELTSDLFSESFSGFRGRVAFTTFILNESGEMVDQFWKELSFDMKDSSFDTWLYRGVDFVQPYEVGVRLQKGTLRVVLYSLKADKLGAASFPFGK